MWGAFRPEDPLPWGEGRKGGFLWGRRLRGRPLTPTLSHGEREEELPRNGGWRGPGVGGRGRATLTPALSLKGEGERRVSWAQGCPAAEAGPGCEERLERKTLTPTLSHGEREEELPRHGSWRGPGVGGRGRATLTPALSLKGEGGRGVRRVLDGLGFEAGLRFEGRFGRKTLTPTLSHRDLCVTSETVARKTPHPNPLPQEREQEPPRFRGRGAFGKDLHGERGEDAPLACQHGCSPAEGAGRRWFISGEGSRAA